MFQNSPINPLGQRMSQPGSEHELRILEPLGATSLEQLLQPHSATEKYSGPSAATVASWLSAVGKLHRAAADSSDFYNDAARFAVETVGLDAAWVLKCGDQSGEWRIVGSSPAKTDLRCETRCLEQLRQDPQTWYQPDETMRLPALVMSPVLDSRGELAAAIYGVRGTRGSNRRRGVRPLEARLVELLAESVAVGIARLQKETEATRTRVLLEQAFSPTVAEYIQQHPEALSGQQREVTLLFADLRGYSAIAETMNLTDCYELLGEVMETLTQVVVAQRGVVVDYYGDGLLALWNAPLEQYDHADLACSAAVGMLQAMPTVAEKWRHRLSGPLELGIGIHSGLAYVGNAGTRSRLKYGPRGNTVNIASRVQAATKQLQLPLVITAATQAKLTEEFFTLRVCTAKLPGLEQPAELYTVYPAAKAESVQTRLDEYSLALAMFESGDLAGAAELLAKLTTLGSITPAHFLAHYTAAQKNGNLGRRAVDQYSPQENAVIEIHSK